MFLLGHSEPLDSRIYVHSGFFIEVSELFVLSPSFDPKNGSFGLFLAVCSCFPRLSYRRELSSVDDRLFSRSFHFGGQFWSSVTSFKALTSCFDIHFVPTTAPAQKSLSLFPSTNNSRQFMAYFAPTDYFFASQLDIFSY